MQAREAAHSIDNERLPASVTGLAANLGLDLVAIAPTACESAEAKQPGADQPERGGLGRSAGDQRRGSSGADSDRPFKRRNVVCDGHFEGVSTGSGDAGEIEGQIDRAGAVALRPIPRADGRSVNQNVPVHDGSAVEEILGNCKGQVQAGDGGQARTGVRLRDAIAAGGAPETAIFAGGIPAAVDYRRRKRRIGFRDVGERWKGAHWGKCDGDQQKG